MKNNNNSFYMLFAKPLISSSPNLPRQILALFYEPIEITLLAHRIFKRFTYVIFQ